MCHVFGEVFEFGNVENGTAGRVFSKTVRVQVQPDFDGAFHHKSHVSMGDVVMSAIGPADSERVEGFGRHQSANLFRCNHGRGITDGLSRFSYPESTETEGLPGVCRQSGFRSSSPRKVGVNDAERSNPICLKSRARMGGAASLRGKLFAANFPA